ncbi:MAG: YncE family protein [Janthinobacterium lividum]
MNLRHIAICIALLGSLADIAVKADTPLMTAGTPVVVPGGPGHFDWMTIDAPRHRLLASHPGKGTLVVYDLKTGNLKQLDTDGEVNGEAIDEVDSKLFVAGGNQKVVVFDLRTLTKIGEIPLTGPADSIEFDPKNGTLYVDHDDGSEIWAISGKSEKVTGIVTIAGTPEALVYNPITDRLYQNIKPANCTQVINPSTNTVEATWSTAPMTSPHGLAIDTAAQRLFTAGQGKVDMIDMKTGTVLSTVGIAPGYVDQIAFDSASRRLYCATSAKGTPASQISVVQETSDGSAATLLGIVTTPKGMHTLAVDPGSQAVWISYADDKDSFVEKLTVSR